MLHYDCHLARFSSLCLQAHTISCLSLSLSLSPYLFLSLSLAIKIYGIYEIYRRVKCIPNNIIMTSYSHVINSGCWRLAACGSSSQLRPLSQVSAQCHLGINTAQLNAPSYRLSQRHERSAIAFTSWLQQCLQLIALSFRKESRWNFYSHGQTFTANSPIGRTKQNHDTDAAFKCELQTVLHLSSYKDLLCECLCCETNWLSVHRHTVKQY
jgi:hypothetical protein